MPRKADGTAHDPNTVYLLGDNEYNEAAQGTSNGRAVLLSTDAGASFTDMTYDATDNLQPHGIHPDQHSIVTNPADWKQFVETGDGGVVRSNGNFVDDSAQCARYSPPLTPSRLATCQAVTSRIPERIESINKGLNNLHFYQMTFNPNRPGELAGGRAGQRFVDECPWARRHGSRRSSPTVRTTASTPSTRTTRCSRGRAAHSPCSTSRETSRPGPGSRTRCCVLGAATFRYHREAAAFIAPTLFHPKVSKLMFTGREHVFRSLNGGINPTFPYAEVEEHCNVWTGNGDIDESGAYVPSVDVCDDWKAMGDPGHRGRLTYGPARGVPARGGPGERSLDGSVPGPVPVGRRTAPAATSPRTSRHRRTQNVVWAATSGGRIFVTTNAAAADPATIAWTRIDPSSSVDPPRYPTDIYIDPSDPHHAYITYSGYNHVTPDTPGHVFEVTYNPTTGAATFTRLDGSGPHAIGDLPVGTIERDEKKGTLYAGTDFGVIRRVRTREPVGLRSHPACRRRRFRS